MSKRKKTKKNSKKRSRKKTKKRKAGKKGKKRKTTVKEDLIEFISLSKKDIEILRIEEDYEKTFRCPQCGRYLAKGAEECPCGVKFIEDLYEPKAEVTDFFKYLYKVEEAPEIKKKVAPPLPPPPLKIKEPEPEEPVEPEPEKPVEPESEKLEEPEPEEPVEPEPEKLEELEPEKAEEPEEPEEPEELSLEGLEELAPTKLEDFTIEELQMLAKKGLEESKKEEVEQPPREMISLMDVPDELEAVVKTGPSRDELSLVDEPGKAEAAERAAERRFLHRRIARDRKLFYAGAALIFLGGPIVALSSWYHDWFSVPLVGDTYDAFGWLNVFAVMIGIVILVVGVIFFVVSLRGGAIANKDFEKLKTEG